MSDPEKLASFLGEARNAIVAGIRRDGRPQLTPNWFFWDGQYFYVSTTRNRAKYSIFKRDPRVELIVDDSTAMRYVVVSGTVEVIEDLRPQLKNFRSIREKQGVEVPADEEEQLAGLLAQDRVMLRITPDRPSSEWTSWGLD